MIYIDGMPVSEDEFLRRVRINEDEDWEFADEFLDLFDILEVDPADISKSIDDFVSRVSFSYLNFLDFYDLEHVEEYIC